MSGSTLSARFLDPHHARAAVDALLAAGIPAGAVSVAGRGHGYEGRFLARIVILIVLWSIPGGAIGAGLGVVLAVAGVGPQGTTGTLVQLVSWLIIGHLLAGMWAGYILLADRSRREMTPHREAGLIVSVTCRNEVEAEAAQRVLGPAGLENSP